jgi:hypothetical protein
MSYDFATRQVCPHKVQFEAVPVDANTRKYATFPRPPSSQDVTVYIDGVQVPKSGLYSYAELPFSKPEPYRIKRDINDLLYLSIGFEPPRFIQLTPGSVSAKDMSLRLQQQLPDLSVSVENKRVVIRTRQPARGTGFQFYDPRWSDKTSSLPTTSRVLKAYSEIGVIPGRAATSVRIFPGWSIERNTSSPLVEDKLLVFEDPLPNADPLVELCYSTVAGYCRRCFGTKLEFDYRVLNGTYETVRDTDLLSQEFDKFLVTKAGSHWKWNWLGSGLIDRIGGKGNTASSNISALVTVDINQAFSTYSSLKQQQDSRFPQQVVTDAEYPLQLSSINVQLLPDDPTIAIVITKIVSRSQQQVDMVRVVGAPNPFSLLNTSSASASGYIRQLSSGFNFGG